MIKFGSKKVIKIKKDGVGIGLVVLGDGTTAGDLKYCNWDVASSAVADEEVTFSKSESSEQTITKTNSSSITVPSAIKKQLTAGKAIKVKFLVTGVVSTKVNNWSNPFSSDSNRYPGNTKARVFVKAGTRTVYSSWIETAFPKAGMMSGETKTADIAVELAITTLVSTVTSITYGIEMSAYRKSSSNSVNADTYHNASINAGTINFYIN